MTIEPTSGQSRVRIFVSGALTVILTLLICTAAAEGVLRLKNASMRNYDVEMWRYSRELKFASELAVLGHEHQPNAKATLQSVEIRTNAWGLRGGAVSEAPAPGRRRVLMLGSSIALGWGVPEESVVSSLLQAKFAVAGQDVEILNAGIGNYNAERYVERFLHRLTPLKPTDLLVLAFVRDGEPLEQGGGNFLLRNSQLALTVWTVVNRVFGESGENSLVAHYQRIYAPGSPAVTRMNAEFAKLAAYAREHRIRVTLAMVPDIHNLDRYPLQFVHDIFGKTARDNGFAYVDLLPALQGIASSDIWAMPGDPHPNARGHALMADAIYPVLASEATPSREQ
ncbi:GDSL-type esterase/lipase family protein [uncultured Bradyrhizobium sp.]|jgi:lysophospholipase L1-like esterase|uniref:SGNH/GDSL hydrolase family protein n=1 Tax=uncultured Bradyrhizobium sp. TaxID=199684 RepID=UPI002616BE40|nr:GDSL-type esterase/lipase family protein [uncultured Bradyrhizobium sp.]